MMNAEQKALSHEPVLLQESIALLQPRSGGVYCDGTAGRGGHAQAILEASAPEGRLLAIDRDPEAVLAVRRRLEPFGERVEVIHGRFSELPRILEDRGLDGVDGVIVDLGVSSPQLEEPARGFSFQREGPIDMRLDPTSGETALELITGMDERELAEAIRDYGEERHARAVARGLKRALADGALETTLDLAAVIRRALRQPRSGRVDSATRTFQAIRIVVNNELGELEELLGDLPWLLNGGGRAVFIAFHSLEDRAVKRGLRGWASCRCAPRLPECVCGGPALELLTRKPIVPSEAECQKNPRARSARLRGAARLDSAILDSEASWAS
jgi:16S rRNA (cytosine1402-N4)-methyltransferase